MDKLLFYYKFGVNITTCEWEFVVASEAVCSELMCCMDSMRPMDVHAFYFKTFFWKEIAIFAIKKKLCSSVQRGPYDWLRVIAD